MGRGRLDVAGIQIFRAADNSVLKHARGTVHAPVTGTRQRRLDLLRTFTSRQRRAPETGGDDDALGAIFPVAGSLDADAISVAVDFVDKIVNEVDSAVVEEFPHQIQLG